MHHTINLTTLKNEMDKRSHLRNLGIVFDDGKSVYLIQHTRMLASSLTPEPTHVLITQAADGVGPTPLVESSGRALNAGELMTEWSSTLLSCGGAVVGAVLLASSTAALPLTGGASFGVLVLAYGGTAASAVQCIRGGYRLYRYSEDGNASYIEQKDSEDGYVALGVLLDTISLASAGGALLAAAKTYRTLHVASHRSALDWLKGMNRSERKRLLDELARQKGLSNQQKKHLIAAGHIPKTVDSANIQKLVRQELLNAAAAAMAMTGSAVAGVIRSPKQVPAAGKYVFSLVGGF